VGGLLADNNVQRHMLFLRDLLSAMDLLEVLDSIGCRFLTFGDVGLPFDIDDRTLWKRCQEDRLVLFTDNRNAENDISLQATLTAMWKPGDLPIITPTSKNKLEQDADYRERVAADIAEVLFGIAEGEYRDRDRIYVPL
jgi:hypothetical protein